VSDVPEWLTRHTRLISALCIALLIGVLAIELLTEEEAIWPLGFAYLSASALGLDAVVKGVRKRVGVGPSIANLAPGGWTIFAGMFWIVAVPAYYIGARRKTDDDEPREPITWGSWAAIVGFALFGVALVCSPLAK
jgi:hypothetical protein